MADRTTEPALNEDNKGPSSTGPKKGNKGLLILGIFLLIGVGAGGVFLFAPSLLPGSLRFGNAHNPPRATEGPANEKQGYIYSMDPFLVNLADPEQPRYLKVRIDIESMESKANDEYEKRLPQLRDAVLISLSSKKANEILDSEGKGKLKEEIAGRINSQLHRFKIKKLYFTEFVVQ